jgi:predicted DNA-binding protein with PD1-like motif
MKVKLVHEDEGQRVLVAVLDTGDEVMTCIGEIARKERLTAAQISGIGAFSDAVLGYFDWEQKQYEKIPVHEQVELVSLLGDIGIDEQGEPALHLHVVLGRRDGRTLGGHLLEARVRPTLELVLTESPAHLHRRVDRATGLSLIEL